MNIKYQNALSEVEEILKRTDEELLEKIPSSVKQFIKENKNEEYIVQIDGNKSLEEQNILSETQAILALIYRTYWATEDERKEFEQQDIIELEKEQQKRTQIYFNDIFENRKSKQKESLQASNEVKDLVLVKEEKWYQKVWNKLCNLFNGHKKT